MFEKKIQEKVEEVKENAKPQVKKYLIQAGIVAAIGIFAWRAGYREGLKTGMLIKA